MPKGTLYESWPPDHPALRTEVIVWIPTERQRQMYREWKRRQAARAGDENKRTSTHPGTDRESHSATGAERSGQEV